MPEQPEPPKTIVIEHSSRPSLASGGTVVPLAVYILYLLSYFGYIPMIIGVVIAYTSKPGSGRLLTAHYRFQIRTFWISLLYVVVVALVFLTLILFPLAILLSSLLVIWLIVRCVRGIVSLQRGEPPHNPGTWLY